MPLACLVLLLLDLIVEGVLGSFRGSGGGRMDFAEVGVKPLFGVVADLGVPFDSFLGGGAHSSFSIL